MSQNSFFLKKIKNIRTFFQKKETVTAKKRCLA